MILFKYFFFKCAFIASFLFAVGCQAEMSDSKNDLNGKIYYASFAGYSLPLKLVEEITEDEAFSRDASYCVGTYEKGVLIRVEKYFGGSLFFKHEYFYYDNGTLKESRTVNDDGMERSVFYDEKGKIIKAD